MRWTHTCTLDDASTDFLVLRKQSIWQEANAMMTTVILGLVLLAVMIIGYILLSKKSDALAATVSERRFAGDGFPRARIVRCKGLLMPCDVLCHRTHKLSI
jgi:hypothetical protein